VSLATIKQGYILYRLLAVSLACTNITFGRLPVPARIFAASWVHTHIEA
jgi:hypothetical protein